MTETRQDGAQGANISRKQPRPTWPKTNAHESSESVFSTVLERNIRNGLPVMALVPGRGSLRGQQEGSKPPAHGPNAED